MLTDLPLQRLFKQRRASCTTKWMTWITCSTRKQKSITWTKVEESFEEAVAPPRRFERWLSPPVSSHLSSRDPCVMTLGNCEVRSQTRGSHHCSELVHHSYNIYPSFQHLYFSHCMIFYLTDCLMDLCPRNSGLNFLELYFGGAYFILYVI